MKSLNTLIFNKKNATHSLAWYEIMCDTFNYNFLPHPDNLF